MAVILDGTNNKITFPDGSDPTSTDVLIKVTYGENNTRTSISPSYNHWRWSVPFSREKSDSDIRVSGMMVGHNNYCYPYYGTRCSLVAPNGTRYISTTGSNYFHTQYDNGNVPQWTEKMWLASELNNQTGSGWKAEFGWSNDDGNNCRPFEMWNYNSNEDSRAWQKGSTCVIREYKQ